MGSTGTVTLSEIYAQLDKAIADIVAKKSVLDDAIVKQEQAVDVVRKANENYASSIQYAQDLRTQLTTTLDSAIPLSPASRVRQN